MIKKIIMILIILLSTSFGSDKLYFGPTLNAGRFVYKKDASTPSLYSGIGFHIKYILNESHSLNLELDYYKNTIRQKYNYVSVSILSERTLVYDFEIQHIYHILELPLMSRYNLKTSNTGKTELLSGIFINTLVGDKIKYKDKDSNVEVSSENIKFKMKSNYGLLIGIGYTPYKMPINCFFDIRLNYGLKNYSPQLEGIVKKYYWFTFLFGLLL